MSSKSKTPAKKGLISYTPCKGCLPEGGFKNIGEMWEVV